MKTLKLRRVMAFGLLARLVLSPLTGHPWDLKVWLDVGKRVMEGDVLLYSLNGRPEWMWGYYAYPPGWMGWCGLVYLFNFNIHLYAWILKLPIILSDLATGYLIHITMKKLGRSEAESTLGAALYILNPVSIFISSVWGMFDAIPAMLTMMALNLFVDKKELRSGILLGLGVLFKLYPLFLISAFLHRARRCGTPPSKLVGFLSATTAAPLAASIPFILRDFKGYANALLSHTAPSGYMSLWFPISHLLYPLKEVGGVLFLTMFVALNALIFQRINHSEYGGKESIYLASLLLMLCFFITSPKVNPQYAVWFLPLLIVDFTSRRSVFAYGSLCGVTALTSLIIMGAMTVNNSFLLVNIGFPDPAVVQSFMAIITVSSILFPILCLTYFRHILSAGVYKPHWPGKMGVALILTVLSLSWFTAPIPMKVNVKAPFILSVPESPATGFSPLQSGYGVREFQLKYRSDGVVLAFGPDFINTYRGYEPERDVKLFFKAYYYDEWTQKNIRELVQELHEGNVKAYLGVFTLKDYLVDGRGYVSYWLGNHSEVVEGGLLRFEKTLIVEGTPQPYYVYFSENMLKAVFDFNFDGVAILNFGLEEVSEGYFEGLLKLVDQLNQSLEGRKEVILCDVLEKKGFNQYESLLNHSDFLIVQALPWSRGVYYMEERYRFERFMPELAQTVNGLGPADRAKVLLTVEVMDEQEGWVNSLFLLKREVGGFEKLDVGGFVLVYANRFSPYSLNRLG